jgi:hypothetical protein
MALTDGERKARVRVCREWRGRLNQVHADAWMVCQEARTPNVLELARDVTRLAIVVREMVDELEREAGSPVAERRYVPS